MEGGTGGSAPRGDTQTPSAVQPTIKNGSGRQDAGRQTAKKHILTAVRTLRGDAHTGGGGASGAHFRSRCAQVVCKIREGNIMRRTASTPAAPRPHPSPSKSIGSVGSHSLKWQHPFVDVFRVFQVPEFDTADKMGDVVSVLVRGSSPPSASVFCVLLVLGLPVWRGSHTRWPPLPMALFEFSDGGGGCAGP